MADKKSKTDNQNPQTGFWWKVYLVYAFFLLFAVGVVIAMNKVIFVEGPGLIDISDKQSMRWEETSAVRGNIYSSDNSLLAVSIPIFTVRMDMHPSVVCDDTLYKYLRPLCDSMHAMFRDKSSEAYYRDFRAARTAKKRNFLVKRNITYSQLDRMRTFPIFKKGQYNGGFVVEEKEKRSNPNGYLALRTIGYYNQESQKGVGLEGNYNTDLQGVNGRRLTQRVTRTIWRPVYAAGEVKPENGYDLITTIDIRIQDVTEAALQRCMEINEAEHGCAAVMEVKTGKIVAIANLTKRSDGTYAEVMNYAVGEAVEPGSTFKLASTIALLEETHMDTGTIVPTGEMQFHTKWMKDSHKGGWGNVSFAKAFAVSSNVGISCKAYEMFMGKEQKFVDYLYKMRLNRPLGLEIAGEGEPYIKNTKDKTWSKISLPWMSIGYEVKVTPLQILSLYNAVANGGRMMKPMFVSEIRKGNEIVKTFAPEVLVSQICSRQTLQTVQGLLQGVVENGTATNLKNDLFKVAAKTGTAQMNYGKGQKITYRASLVGYFPADNPRYSCIVMITNPQKNRIYGGSVAGPVFNEISKKLYATLMQGGLDVKPASGVQYGPNMTGGYAADIKAVYRDLGIREPDLDPTVFVRKNTDKVSPDGFRDVVLAKDKVPDLRGMGLRDASYILEGYGLKMVVYGRGWVKKQTPEAGTPCAKGQTVVIELS